MSIRVQFLSKAEVTNLAVEIARKLHGVPLSQVRNVLDKAERIVFWGHTVDVEAQRFSDVCEVVKTSPTDPDLPTLQDFLGSLKASR